MRSEVAQQILEGVKRLEEKGPASVKAEYDRQSVIQKGMKISWKDAKDRTLEGVAVGLGEFGELLVEMKNHEIKKIYADDVSIDKKALLRRL